VWIVKHAISPIDSWVVKTSRGRIPPLSSLAVPTLLLTTTGRRTGELRTTPLVYVRSGDNYLVANARPQGERRNPWVLNLEASGRAHIRVAGKTRHVAARRLDDHEAEHAWPALVKAWPAFDQHYSVTGERTVFVLEPIRTGSRDGWSPAMRRKMLLGTKTVHTAVWIAVEAAVIYLVVTGLAGRMDRKAAVSGFVVVVEGSVFLANGARCPLSDVAESLGAERGSVTDIFLPDWFARNLPAIHVPFIALILYLHGRNLRSCRRRR
jgi:deazaflavin-dependent oxidoreductase (nitroreductase family)